MNQNKQEQIREKARELIAQTLKGNYSCGRVWEAWQVGTMTQDDFTPLEEDDDVINDLVADFEALLIKTRQEAVEEGRDEVLEAIGRQLMRMSATHTGRSLLKEWIDEKNY